ncbi:MAG: FAD binding domain-containing protein, partial [Candidatus Cloacimonetes bacterium]|nr:FAD binding domain-containing protein [Candidatus Cloacimonadota bacterium]
MKNFDFIKLSNLSKTLLFLSAHPDECKIIVGGTDLIIELRKENNKLNGIKYIVDIGHLTEFKRITFSEMLCSIGANTTFSEIIESRKIQDNFPLLWNASQKIGSPQIRNVATIGGNICNLASAADSIPPLLVYDAKVKIISSKDEKLVSLKSVLKSPQKIDLQP